MKIISTRSYDKLMKLAYTDSLTGCYNRNWLEENRGEFNNQVLYVSIIDVNDLKKINDVYGHDAGDKLLIAVSEKLLQITDNTVRLGGDEFLLLSSHDITQELYNAKLHIAFGAGLLQPDLDLYLSNAMRIADKNMYHMKQKQKRVN